MGKWFIVAGGILVIVGIVLHFFPGIFGWFGRLPGDIRIDGGRTRIFVPITSMVIVSIILTILLNLFRH